MIKPTIGRKVWFWTASEHNAMDPKQAFDATVIYVDPAGSVTLKVVDHHGKTTTELVLSIEQPTDMDGHGVRTYACWMPYQVGQARAATEVDKAATANA